MVTTNTRRQPATTSTPQRKIQFAFKAHKDTGERVFGPLETRILEAMWALQSPTTDVTVAHVHKMLRAYDGIAYTTVMTTMSRMAAKGLLKQDKSEAAYTYAVAFSKEQMERYVVYRIIKAMLAEELPVAGVLADIGTEYEPLEWWDAE